MVVGELVALQDCEDTKKAKYMKPKELVGAADV